MLDLDFIETAHGVAASDASWGMALAERFARLVPEAAVVMAAPYRVDLAIGGGFLEIVGDEPYMANPTFAARSHATWDAVNASRHRRLFLERTYASPAPSVLSLSELPREHGAPIRNQLPWPAGDCIGLFATLDGARGYKLSPVSHDSIRVSRRRRAQLVRLCEHVATGYWLRSLRTPERPPELDAEAVYTPDGSTLHETGVCREPPLHDLLVDAVRSMDRARCRRNKRSPHEATELWQALVAGQYALVESFERNGRRLILAVRCRSPRPSLTPREAAVAAAAARGFANKHIAYELGIAPSTVAVHLAAALRKLGCPNRRSLFQWLTSRG